MNKPTPEFCRQLAEARRAKGITQSALAREAGCTQSAVSMFEKGDPTKIAWPTIEKIAKALGVELPKDGASTEAAPAAVVHVHGFCPNCSCPSNVPYAVDCRVVFSPVRRLASPDGGARCVVCGEVLETSCPVCGAPLNDGACCAACGSPYVTAVIPPGADPDAWAKNRRAEIRDIRELSV